MKAATYYRVSSKAQAKDDTIASQRHEIPRDVAALGWKLAREFEDEGFSASAGKLDKRSGFARMLAEMERGAFDVVVVRDFDRLTRTDDIAERGQILGAFQKAGVKIYCTSTRELIDPTGPTDMLITWIKAWVSAEDNRKRVDATSAGRRRAAREGRKPCGVMPYGLTYDKEAPEGQRFGIDPERGKVARDLIFGGALAGQSTWEIAINLFKRGVLTQRGKQWSQAAVYRTLGSTAYYGEYKWGEHTIKIPAIVTRAEWDRVQATLRERAHSPAKPRVTVQTYIVQGLAVCGVCGARVQMRTLYREAKKGRTKYICGKRNMHAACKAPLWDQEETDARAWAKIVEYLDPNMIRRAMREAQDDDQGFEKDLADAEKKLDALNKKEAAIVRQFNADTISEETMQGLLKENAGKRRMLETHIAGMREASAGVRTSKAHAAAILDTVATLRAQADKASPERRRELARALMPQRAPFGVKLHENGEIEMYLRFVPAPLGSEKSFHKNASLPSGGDAVTIRVVA